MPTQAAISLGSNVGDRRSHLDEAVASIGAIPGVEVGRVSSYHETRPVGGPAGQGGFLNAAMTIRTTLGPRDLIAALQAIETRTGRVREVRWGARTLDVDLLLYGKWIHDEPDLTIPHPRMWVRRFVLAPLAEVAPMADDPLTGRTVTQALARLDQRPSVLGLDGLPSAVVGAVMERLGAVGLFGGVGSLDPHVPDDSDDWIRDRRQEADFFEALDRLNREYDAGRWSPEVWGDRWIVCDFWPEKLVFLARLFLKGEALNRWLGLYREPGVGFQSPRFIRPTFIAARPDLYHTLRTSAEMAPGDPLVGADIPILCPGYPDPFGWFQERFGPGGLYERSVPIDDFVDPGPEQVEAITAEILAACESSRG